MPEQQTKVEISLDSIMEKLLKVIRESSLIKYRADILKMEDRFAIENDKKKENLQSAASSFMGLFQTTKEDDLGEDISSFDKEEWE